MYRKRELALNSVESCGYQPAFSNVLERVTGGELSTQLLDNDYHYSDMKAHALDAEKVAMYERASHLTDILVTWVVIADVTHAQMYECRPTVYNGLSKIPYLGWDDEYDYKLLPIADGAVEAELTNEYRGSEETYQATFTHLSSDGIRHDVYQDIQRELDERFVRAIARKLELAYEKGAFDRVVLVVPRHMMAALSAQCSEKVRSSIVGSMPRNIAAHAY